MATTIRKVKRYGWRPDTPDHRDRIYHATISLAVPPPPKVDLRPGVPIIFNQGNLGSCTANAVSGLNTFVWKKQFVDAQKPVPKIIFIGSRLFLYLGERIIEGTVAQDAGAEIRDGMKVLAAQGVPSEKLWPYKISAFAKKPPKSVYAAALQHQSISYARIAQGLAAQKACLAEGYPFVFGFTVYESFESDEVAKTGEVPMPKPSESALGGHAVMAVGYDDAAACIIVANSWGEGWGEDGYFCLPYAYVTNPYLASDFWTLRRVEQ